MAKQTDEIKLNRDQMQLLHQAESKIANAGAQIPKLRDCGGECDGLQADYDLLAERCRKIRQHFGG